MLICILTKNVITSCSVTMMLFLHLEVKPVMTLTTVPYLSCFFFQAEDGIRDVAVTGVQTCALPISCTTEATGRDVVLSGFFSSTRIFPHHHPDPELVTRAEAALDRLGIAHLADRPLKIGRASCRERV